MNGIPLVVIECKSPVSRKTGVFDAQDQLKRYQEEIPRFFYTNEILIGCNLFGAKYGVIEAPLEHFHEWKAPNGDKIPNMAEHPTVKEMLELGFIDKKDLSPNPPLQEVLIACILKKKNLLDIVRNFIVFDYSKEEHKIIKKICRYQQFSAVNKIVKRVTEEPYKRGIIWHWQGSGKSLIMVFAATKLRREEEKLKNPIILIVSDRIKLDRQITDQFRDSNFPNPIHVDKESKLYSLLKGGDGCTIMATVQKFRKPLQKPLSEKENIIVLTDEAHRTQYGNFGFNLRKALPNASIFAFTGTPLNKKDRNTYKHFSAPRRIERIAMDIVEHYASKILPNGFKAQIVAVDKKTAVMYKNALDKLIDPAWSTVVITVDNDDPKEWKERYKRTGAEEDELTGKDVFLNPDDPLKILIVCDKLLTGFDAPILQVMYLDQRLREHTLLQTVARTNRPYPRKNFGLVVDYVGVGKELAKALAIFDREDLEGFFSVDDIKKELAYLKDWREKTMAIFKRVNKAGSPPDVIQQCMEILKPEDRRSEFLKGLERVRQKERDRDAVAREKGMTSDEFSFYGLFELFKDRLFGGDDEKRCSAAKEIAAIIMSKKVIDWIDKEDIKKEMRREIKELLKKIKFPEDKIENFKAEIMNLAEAKFKDSNGKS